VSINNRLRASGSPAATHRSQNPDTMAVSGVPARPACVSHADSSAKKASFMPRLYSRKVQACTERVYRGAMSAVATDRILVADRRFRGITDMAGAAAGRTRTRMTRSRHQRIRIWAKRQGGGGSPLPHQHASACVVPMERYLKPSTAQAHSEITFWRRLPRRDAIQFPWHPYIVSSSGPCFWLDDRSCHFAIGRCQPR
jgi:hypothetical protein